MSAARARILAARNSATCGPRDPERRVCRFIDGHLHAGIATTHRQRFARQRRQRLRIKRRLALAALVRA